MRTGNIRSAGRYGVLLLAGLLGSCYRYVPTSASATPGAHVRLTLHTPAGPELTRVLGADVVAVEGRVMRASDTELTLAVSATLKPGAMSAPPRRTVWAGEHVAIPASAVRDTELRSLDRKRTTRLVAVSAVAAVVAVRLIVSVTGSSSGGGGDDGGVVIPP